MKRPVDLNQLQLDGIEQKDWKRATQFHSLEEKEVLDEVQRRVSNSGMPVVLLDLDSTLYQVEYRSLQILREWSTSPESLAFSEVRTRMGDLSLSQVGYSVRHTFKNLGIHQDQEKQAFESAKNYWSERFFTNHWLTWDRPYLGAVQFVSELHRLGAKLVYLTGRDEPGMRSGTVSNLKRDGFPWGDSSVHLWMKPHSSLSDQVFKKSAAERLFGLGHLVASFENEPHNVATLQQIFPEAMHVWLDTLCSDHPAPTCQGLYRLRGFDAVLGG